MKIEGETRLHDAYLFFNIASLIGIVIGAGLGVPILFYLSCALFVAGRALDFRYDFLVVGLLAGGKDKEKSSLARFFTREAKPQDRIVVGSLLSNLIIPSLMTAGAVFLVSRGGLSFPLPLALAFVGSLVVINLMKNALIAGFTKTNREIRFEEYAPALMNQLAGIFSNVRAYIYATLGVQRKTVSNPTPNPIKIAGAVGAVLLLGGMAAFLAAGFATGVGVWMGVAALGSYFIGVVLLALNHWKSSEDPRKSGSPIARRDGLILNIFILLPSLAALFYLSITFFPTATLTSAVVYGAAIYAPLAIISTILVGALASFIYKELTTPDADFAPTARGNLPRLAQGTVIFLQTSLLATLAIVPLLVISPALLSPAILGITYGASAVLAFAFFGIQWAMEPAAPKVAVSPESEQLVKEPSVDNQQTPSLSSEARIMVEQTGDSIKAAEQLREHADAGEDGEIESPSEAEEEVNKEPKSHETEVLIIEKGDKPGSSSDPHPG